MQEISVIETHKNQCVDISNNHTTFIATITPLYKPLPHNHPYSVPLVFAKYH